MELLKTILTGLCFLVTFIPAIIFFHEVGLTVEEQTDYYEGSSKYELTKFKTSDWWFYLVFTIFHVLNFPLAILIESYPTIFSFEHPFVYGMIVLYVVVAFVEMTTIRMLLWGTCVSLLTHQLVTSKTKEDFESVRYKCFLDRSYLTIVVFQGLMWPTLYIVKPIYSAVRYLKSNFKKEMG